MGLLQASLVALEAARSGDLDAVAQALDAREKAIRDGELPTEEVVGLGEQLKEELQSHRAALRADEARVRQLSQGFCPTSRVPLFDVCG